MSGEVSEDEAEPEGGAEGSSAPEREEPTEAAPERSDDPAQDTKDAPKKKKKKKRKKAAEPHEEEPAYSLPFARSWPKDPELSRLVDAFERGNYAHIRHHAEQVAKDAGDPRVRDAARDLRRRIDPDPLAGALVLIAIGLLVFLASHYLGHKAGDAPSKEPIRVAPHPTAT